MDLQTNGKCLLEAGYFGLGHHRVLGGPAKCPALVHSPPVKVMECVSLQDHLGSHGTPDVSGLLNGLLCKFHD